MSNLGRRPIRKNQNNTAIASRIDLSKLIDPIVHLKLLRR